MIDKNTNWEVAKPLVLSLAVIVGMIFGSRLTVSSPVIQLPVSDTSERSNIAAEALRYIYSHYVDTLDMGKLNEEAIRVIMTKLDPHSTYIPPAELQGVNRKMQGHYKGIGIEFLSIEDTLYVTKVIEDSPAYKIGLEIGDKILSYNDFILSGTNTDPNTIALNMLNIVDDEISIKILRQNDTLIFNTVRERINTSTIPIAITLDDDINYIKIESFNADTYREFMESVENFSIDGKIKNLIIDVRDNPGGYLDAIIKIVSQLFEEKGKMIVYTEGASSRKVEYKTGGRSFFDIENIIILVNETSASASEILAGAIQDHDRGMVIGKRTFGKGLVQEQYPLSNGGAIRLTVSRFYTPSGRSIQKDFLGSLEDYEKEVYTRQPDSLFVSDTMRTFRTSVGRTVYGGGGITPDIFINTSPVGFGPLREISQLVLVKDILKVYQYYDLVEDSNSSKSFWQRLQSDFNILKSSEKLNFEKNTLDYISLDEKSAKDYFIERIMYMKFGQAETLKYVYNNDLYIKKAIELLRSNTLKELLSPRN